MIRINLLPARVVSQASSRRKELGLAGGMLATTAIAILAAHIFQASQLNETNATVARLETQLTEIRKENQDLEKMKRQKKDLEEKNKVIGLLTAPQRRIASVRVLDDLSTSTPEFLWITDYSENKGVAQIRGKAIDNQTIASFAHNLSGSQRFRSVEIRETQQEAQTGPSRNKTGKNDPKKAPAQAVMMTKFLIETGVNYGQPLEIASTEQDGQESAQEKKGKKASSKAKNAAAAKADKE
jgi:Tfp pilus assembly protein PilN